MALNKLMHPRNIYKTPPNFSNLAKSFEEFRNIAKEGLSGKVSIDFKDPHALRVLTKCLLKADFNLDVCIPADRLVPTLPLRLNYILWLEDLLKITEKNNGISGVDIGTGACAIYPLLAAVKNKWQMIGTETDEDSFTNAKNNVERNNLNDLIEVRKNSTTSVIEYIFLEENSQSCDFSMCNPPFYTNFQELWESRSPARPQPKNGFTGSPQELITEGGELQFCRKMIEESKRIPQKVLIFTTMVGHKYNLKELILDLKAEGIKYTTTEFCQGRVTRWGLAWTYQNYDFSKTEVINKPIKKSNIPITLLLPQLDEIDYNLDIVVDKIKNILEDLKVKYKKLSKNRHEITLDVIAKTNTWSNQRRKRRLLKREADVESKMPKISDTDKPTTSVQHSTSKNEENDAFSSITKCIDGKIITSERLSNSEDNAQQQEVKTNDPPILHGTLKILNKDKKMFIQMDFLEGAAGKEGVHQIVQYIKNNWK